MADTYTTNLNLTKPEPGAAEDTWGISLNADLDSLDAIFSSSGTQINLNPNQINFADGKKAVFGNSSDLSIYHDGSNSYIKNSGTGNLYIQDTDYSGDVYIQAQPNENSIIAYNNSSVVLFYDNAQKLTTQSTGIDVTGTVKSDGLTVDGVARAGNGGVVLEGQYSSSFPNPSANGYFQLKTNNQDVNRGGITIARSSDTSGTMLDALRIDYAGDISFYDDTGTSQNLKWDASADTLNFVDNAKATFGASNDLDIWHSGTNSFIQHLGTGDLYIRNLSDDKSILLQSDNGSGGLATYINVNGYSGTVTLSHYGSQKLITNSTGIDVTGTVTSDGLTVGANDKIQFGTSDITGIYRTNSGSDFTMQHWGNLSMLIDSDNNDSGTRQFMIGRNSQDASTAAKIALFSEGGDISFYDDTGTTQGLFWDASAERLGIGTTSLTHTIHVVGSHNEMALFKRSVAGNSEVKIDTTTSGDAKLTFASNGTSAYTMGRDNSDSSFRIASGGTIGVNDRLVINSSGSVGIGTSSPSQKLSVNGNLQIMGNGTDNDSHVLMFNNGAAAIARDNNDLELHAFNAMVFGVSNTSYPTSTERMRIDSSGNVLVGTTTAPNGTSVYGAGFINTGANGLVQWLSGASTTASLSVARFYNPNGNVGSIQLSGSSTSYATSSDARLKDVTGEARGLEVITKLNPVAYNWKADGKADEGLIAQEVKELVPNAVTGSEDEHYQMDYSKLVTHLVKAVQELEQQTIELKKEIANLKGE